MNKILKRILIFVISAAVIVGGVFGGLVLYRNASRKPVNVYEIMNFTTSAEWENVAESYGMVRTDKMQKVSISDTQSVTEIYVSEGDSVKAGEPILTYDTTLTDIDLQKAQLALQRAQLQLSSDQAELVKLNAMQPGYSYVVEPEQTPIEYKTVETMKYISGAGTSEDPFYLLYQNGDGMDIAFLQSLIEKKAQLDQEAAEKEESNVPEESSGEDPAGETEDPSESNGTTENDPSGDPADPGNEEDEPGGEIPDDPSETKVYAAFVTRLYNALNGPILSSWGLCCETRGENLTFQYYMPVLSEEIMQFDEPEEPYIVEGGSEYTQEELVSMRKEKAQAIRDDELAVKMAQVELDRLTEEKNDGAVKATTDGVVKVVRDPDSCAVTGEPVIEISGGGGYYIEVAMGELDLGNLKLGDPVTVNSWETGETCQGIVQEISEYPTTNADAWSNGNTNVSYYPFTVFVSEEYNLMENSYVNVTYNTAGTQEQEGEDLYLDNMMIRSENGKRYVMIENENGTLEKRFVATGKDLWGSYTQIRSGLNGDEFIAFPYGSSVEEGAKTNHADMAAFYGDPVIYG